MSVGFIRNDKYFQVPFQAIKQLINEHDGGSEAGSGQHSNEHTCYIRLNYC
jgi:hypothetical protein